VFVGRLLMSAGARSDLGKLTATSVVAGYAGGGGGGGGGPALDIEEHVRSRRDDIRRVAERRDVRVVVAIPGHGWECGRGSGWGQGVVRVSARVGVRLGRGLVMVGARS